MIRVATVACALCATLHSVPALADAQPNAPVPSTPPVVVAVPEPPLPRYAPSGYSAPRYANGYSAPSYGYYSPSYSTGEDRRAATLPADDVVPKQDWRLTGYLGGFGDPQGGGVSAGASFRYRRGLFVVGGAVEDGAAVLDYEYWGAALQAGLALRPTRHVRLELLGSIGEHFYENVGRDTIIGNDPGVKGSTGYAGGRATVSYLFGAHLGHFELGAYADFQDDLSRQRVTDAYPATGSGLFDGAGTGEHVIGTSRLGFGLEIGGSHDIF